MRILSIPVKPTFAIRLLVRAPRKGIVTGKRMRIQLILGLQRIILPGRRGAIFWYMASSGFRISEFAPSAWLPSRPPSGTQAMDAGDQGARDQLCDAAWSHV